MRYSGLWAGMLKNQCHICNKRPPIYLSFVQKLQFLNLEPKMPYLGVFGQQL